MLPSPLLRQASRARSSGTAARRFHQARPRDVSRREVRPPSAVLPTRSEPSPSSGLFGPGVSLCVSNGGYVRPDLIFVLLLTLVCVGIVAAMAVHSRRRRPVSDRGSSFSEDEALM